MSDIGLIVEKRLERKREYMRRWDAANPEKRSEYNRKWRAANPEKISKYTGQWRAANRDKCSEYNRQFENKHPIRVWARQALTRKREQGFLVKISPTELEAIASSTGYCRYCGYALNYIRHQGVRQWNNMPSLDRKENGRVIDTKSIQIICRRCNTTKFNRTHDEFINYCRDIVAKFGGAA